MGSRPDAIPIKRRRLIPPPFYWCGQQDSNLHAHAMEPKSTESTNSTMPAYSVFYRVFLLRCPKFSVRCPLTKFRPRPRAQLASSAPGGARIASQFHHARIEKSLCFYSARQPGWGISPDPRFIKTGKPVLTSCRGDHWSPAGGESPPLQLYRGYFIMRHLACQSKGRRNCLNPPCYVYKKSVRMHISPLTFRVGPCKIDSVWCTLAVEVSTGTSVSLITGDSSRGMRFVPVWVFVMILSLPATDPAGCHTLISYRHIAPPLRC